MHLALSEKTIRQGVLSCQRFEGRAHIEADIAQLVRKRFI